MKNIKYWVVAGLAVLMVAVAALAKASMGADEANGARNLVSNSIVIKAFDQPARLAEPAIDLMSADLAIRPAP